MPKQKQIAVENDITLTGVYSKAVLDIMDCLGDNDYNFYDSDFTVTKDPLLGNKRPIIYFKIRVEVQRAYRHRAADYIKAAIDNKEKSWSSNSNYVATPGGINQDQLNQLSVSVNPSVAGQNERIIRLDIKPVAGGGSGGGAEETAINECNQALIAAYVFNEVPGHKLEESTNTLLSHEAMRDTYNKHCELDVSFDILQKFGLDLSWKVSHIKGANQLWEKFGRTHNASKRYKFYRGSGFDDGELKSAYTKCKKNMGNGPNGKPSTTKFSSEDKWNPADIWIASHTYNPKELNECTNIDELNHHLLANYKSNDLFGVSLKKITNANVKWDERNVHDFNQDPVDKVENYKFVVKNGQGGYDLQFHSPDKKSPYPMDVYLYYGPKEYNKFQCRNFAGSSKGSWQIELKGASAAQGRVGGGVVSQLLRDSGVTYKGLTDLDNNAMWSRCNENHPNDSTRDKVNHDIERLLKKYKAKDDRKKLECNDIISDLAELTTSYRYSKLLSLMLLDCIATSPNSADLIRRLYIYASSQSDKSGPHVKME